ncbi:hypothetical protein [Methanotorris igneus]|uniref:Uncharacterized protein n=1 Tax=Methanotorris igneus (strain DSM 5666 / JCM 11834 / Kol 5) TaxID=880724 RepID=F6BER9_METIK|nr:hypothetical protein [Methanotorris igneus]AEF96866.1 hypothetical protein Metig_1329 [Methanotorris igneus Kol 5]
MQLNLKKKLYTLIFVILGLILLYAISPILHPFFMFFYKNPSTIELGFLVVGIIVFLAYRQREINRIMYTILMLILGYFVVLSPVLYIANAYSLTTLQKENIPKDIENFDGLEFDNGGGFLRILPKKVAETYMISSLEYPRYTIDSVHITTFNNSMFWFAYLEPDGLFNRVILKSKGIFMIPVNTTERVVIREEKNIEYTPGQLITDNLYWKLYRVDYFADYGKPRVVVKENKIYTIVPQIKYRFHGFYTTPYWSGIVVLDEEGNIRYYSKEEALKRFGDSPIFPESLARRIVESQNYWKSSPIANILNLWFKHENEIELVDSDENKQPYLIMVDKKPYWVLAVEPYGRAYGISRIYVIGMDGNIMQYKFSDPKIGPIKGMDYVQKSLPTYDWDKFEIVEPLPIFVDGKLYWRYIIIPKSGGGISKIVLVDVETGDVEIFNSYDEYSSFIKNGGTESIKKVTIKDIIKYEKNGNTHWLIILSNGSYVDLSAGELNIEGIIKISKLKVGDVYNSK